MLSADSRDGARVLPETEDIAAGCKARGTHALGATGDGRPVVRGAARVARVAKGVAART